MEGKRFLLLSVIAFYQTKLVVSSSCINITKCPVAMKYLDGFRKNRIHESSLRVLGYAYCGFSGTERKVLCDRIPSCYRPRKKNDCAKTEDCCIALRVNNLNVPGNLEAERRLKAEGCSFGDISECTALLEVEERIAKERLKKLGEDVCLTPSGAEGRCIPWQECPHFNTKYMYARYLDYMKSSACDKKYQKICCGLHENVHAVCGSVSRRRRIVGGKRVIQNKYPWVVVLEYSNPRTVCGGNLINSQFVVTTAHCVRSDLKRVRFRGKNLKFDIIDARIHPNYTPRETLKYDIVLLRIPIVTYQDNIKWICLPTPTWFFPRHFVVVGNGYTKADTRSLSEYQMETSLPYVEASVCEKYYSKPLGNYTNFVLCAGGKWGTDSCVGDSGGPLMSKDITSRWQLFGLITGSKGGCGKKIPSIYTRIDKFLDWINDNMKEMLDL